MKQEATAVAVASIFKICGILFLSKELKTISPSLKPTVSKEFPVDMYKSYPSLLDRFNIPNTKNWYFVSVI